MNLETKNIISVTKEDRINSPSWDEATMTWDEASNTWDRQSDIYAIEAKNIVNLTLESK